MTTPVLLIVLS